MTLVIIEGTCFFHDKLFDSYIIHILLTIIYCTIKVIRKNHQISSVTDLCRCLWYCFFGIFLIWGFTEYPYSRTPRLHSPSYFCFSAIWSVLLRAYGINWMFWGNFVVRTLDFTPFFVTKNSDIKRNKKHMMNCDQNTIYLDF